MVAKKMKLAREMYFAIMLDRATSGPVVIACPEGGTSIEDLAHAYPDKIIKASCLSRIIKHYGRSHDSLLASTNGHISCLIIRIPSLLDVDPGASDSFLKPGA